MVGAAAGAASAYAVAREPRAAAPEASATGPASVAPPALAETKTAEPATLYKDLVLRSEKLRVERAHANAAAPVPAHPNNGDEALYPTKLGSDTRGLPHNDRGEVDGAAWLSLQRALDSQDPADFERVALGGTRKLQQPLGTLAVSLSGLSASQFAIPPAPAVASAERAAEAVESYWKALLRDVPFHEYRSDTKNELVLAASAELSKLAGYTGPRDASGKVTPEVLFRGTARYIDAADKTGRTARSVVPPGVDVGPHISQFILRDIPYGAQTIPGLIKAQAPGSTNDFLLNYEEWLANQDGKPHKGKLTFSSTPRRVVSGRDLAEYAHGGSPGFWGASQLVGTAVAGGGLGVPFNQTNPYLKLHTTNHGVASFGLAHIQLSIPLAASREIRANYWQKWFVQRTLRPEAYGGLVHLHLSKRVSHPVHEDILRSDALARSFKLHGSYLLPSAYPEGAPNHSSYPGGASASAAVSATILKAFYDETFVIPDPVEPDPKDPSRLIPYQGPPLTIGGELNKLATNVGQGRNWAGIHFRSDAAASLPHSEDVAIALLRDERDSFREPFDGFEFTRFDGTKVRI
ncbi:MAG: hypothetical protein RLZZ450_2422 [Pseudomonadota bacterium]